jgi:23S rRNA pseudouridine1911/1915/1917 synthase
MTAKATARALRVDLATVTKLVRHEIRDVPLQPERIPLHVVYEDECMMAVAKPSGVMTYPAHRLRGGSVVSRAVHHLNVEAAMRRGEDLSDSSSVFSAHEPIAVHRLDLETSGLLLLAKDKRTADRAPVAVRGEAGAKDLPRGVRGVGGRARRAKGGGDARQDPRGGGGSGGK